MLIHGFGRVGKWSAKVQYQDNEIAMDSPVYSPGSSKSSAFYFQC